MDTKPKQQQQQKPKTKPDDAHSNRALGTEKISKLLRKFAVPCIISLLISALYNIIDQIFIGNSRLGFLGNAATSVVFPITIISFAFAWCFGDGAVALMSIRQGQKDEKGVSKIIGNALIANVIVSLIFIAVCFIFMDPLLNLFGASEASLPLAEGYFRIILYAATASMMGGVLSNIIRADGSPAFSMFTTVLGVVLNVILDPLFIFGFDWGIEGAALATIIGQIATFLVGLYYIFFRARTFKLHLSDFKPHFHTILSFTKLGISTFITQMAIVITALVGNMMLAKWGAQSVYGIDIPIAVMGIVVKVFTIVVNIVVGLFVGAQPILGFNYGAKKYDRVKETFRTALKVAIIAGLVATAIFELCPDLIIGIFGTGNDLYLDFARKMFRIYLAFICLTVSIKGISIFFQAVGEPKKATVASLTRDLICFCPLCLILPNFFGIDGVIYAAPVADLIGIAVAGTLAFKFYRKLGQNDAVETSENQEIQASHSGVIITISREHGSAGKEIGKLVAAKLDIPFYYKELLAVAAKESGLSEEYLSNLNRTDEKGIMRDLFLSSAPAEYAIAAQQKTIKEVAKHGSCVIVGRAADYVLRNQKNLLRVYISAPEKYKVKMLKEMYGDSAAEAKKFIKRSDANRASYYNIVSGQTWGDRQNYDLCIDSSAGPEATAELIATYARSRS